VTLLRVLVVEDSPSDLKLVLRALRTGYPDLHVERVEDAPALRAALAAGSWDVVLSDWSLPAFSGAAALGLVAEMGLDLPFIIVSGSIGEETAVEAMRHGARDYVLKDRLARLPSAVEREVRQARIRAELRERRRQDEQTLREAHEELERRVEQRTGELHVANDRLAAELLERRRAEEAIGVAKQAAEAANRAKSVFLASMSHEIRTPMNSILGYAQLLQRDDRLTGEQRDMLGVIQRSGDHLLSLINDVLEMSKIEAGHRHLVKGNVDLRALLDDVERMFRLRCEAAVLSFTVQRAHDVPRYVVGDEGKLRQVLVNLLGNAVKFTKQGGVTVHVSLALGGQDRLVVRIADTGPGIGPDDYEEIFRPFVQARAGVREGGTGLGLSLSREFARLMGGDITVESRVGQGSVFTFEIPFEPGEGPITGRRLPSPGRVQSLVDDAVPRRILVADDDEDARGWLTELLRQVGFQVDTAADGVDAVAVCKARRPHLVLMDLNMPRMDGYAAMRALRAIPGGPPMAIVAVTATAFDEGRDAIFEAGADGWLRKPVSEADLFDEIARHLSVRYRYAPARPARSFSPQPGAILPLVAGSPDLRDNIIAVARIGDYERLIELIKQLPPEQARIAEELSRLAANFAYDRIELLLGAGR
jgi:signal transduction histidine kinase